MWYTYICTYIPSVAPVVTLLDGVEIMLFVIGILVDVADEVVVNIST